MTKGSSFWKKTRNIFNQVHLYAGLVSGLVVIAVCLSGTIYVYNTEIREWADSERYFVEEGTTPISLDELKEGLETQLNAKVNSVFVSNSPGRTVQFSALKEGEKGRGTTYFVNPYTAEILGSNSERTKAEEFMGYMFSLHRWLLLDRIETPILESMGNRDLGRLINGIATSLFLLGVLTGIVIWFPQKVKNWKQGMKVKWSANWKRVNHDLHNTLAFYSLLALFLMSVTGPFWSFQWYREGWQKTWDTYQAPPSNSKQAVEEKSEPVGKAFEFSLDEVVSNANAELSYPGNLRISLPKDAYEPISVSKYRTGFFARSGADQLSLSQTDLAIQESNLFSDQSFRQQIGRSVKSLHTGEIFGQFTKFLWFLACLIATSLPVTGTLIWWNKRKKKASRKKKTKHRAIAEYA
ncbi:PepSY-associated TM helix domain-containing protein [Algoriphagus sp. CAU 1675]|uniref:PepSY-associated TM helix domain-containing protein n=1 Tax=Algoriphagus sp. CAU 1675 TaxID=3032597 RepID=UPI0023D99801|nr:PepSY-associated TM helix domain-containing protein [Algoriphagus sp. CAU 1675]MDF2158507.1 PepSY-associated TM helix domain-containing protein [Algoriphagus sp. CAU 1675]